MYVGCPVSAVTFLNAAGDILVVSAVCRAATQTNNAVCYVCVKIEANDRPTTCDDHPARWIDKGNTPVSTLDGSEANCKVREREPLQEH